MTYLDSPVRPRSDPRTPRWLRAGTLAGPLFTAVSLAQVPFRDGFDLTRHAFSFLLLGPGGWLQAVNFVLTGALYVGCGVGLRAGIPGRTGAWCQGLVTAVGAGMIVAGLFRPDPSYGYPAGAPAGIPATLSTGSIVHGLAFVLAMLSWCGLLAVLAARLRRLGQGRWAATAAVTAVGLLVVPAVSGRPFGTVLLYVVATSAFLITSALLFRIEHAAR